MPKTTTCGHEPYYAKEMCKTCYNADYAARHRDRRSVTDRLWREANPERYRVAQNAWREANAERKAAYAKAWVAANREQYMARKAAWRKANREHERAYTRAWMNAHPEQVRVSVARRRARKYTDADLTAEQWLAILAEFDNRCAYCSAAGVPLQLEHMTPLVRGGRHTASNVVPACGPCNRAKHTQTAEEFLGL